MKSEDEVLRSFDSIRKALMSNDVSSLETLFAHDYRGFNLRGGVDNRDLILQAYQPGNVKLDTFDVEEKRVEVIGDVGIVTGCGYLHGSYGGETWEHHIRFLDIFINREGRWLYYLSQGTEISGD